MKLFIVDDREENFYKSDLTFYHKDCRLVKGTGSGDFDFSCSVSTSNIKGIFLYENVTFFKSSKSNLTLNRKSIPQNDYKPTLEVDADGDGSPEKQVSPQVAL